MDANPDKMPENPENTVPFEALEKGNVEDLKLPTVEDGTLDRICALETDEADDLGNLRLFLMEHPESKLALLQNLANRDIAAELPAEHEDYPVLAKNIAECQELQKSVWKAIGDLEKDPKAPIDETKIARLLTLERRKANWLEIVYYPALFAKPLEHARGDVNRFMLEYRNTGGDGGGDADNDRSESGFFLNKYNPKVNLCDDVNYIYKGFNPKSRGRAVGKEINMRVSQEYADSDDWQKYNDLVHEMVHTISVIGQNGRQGIYQGDQKSSLWELNEAVTEIVTMGIVSKHFEDMESDMEGQKPVEPASRPYAKYIAIVQSIFSKVPERYFVDAMLNPAGLDVLRKKFEEAFGDPNALTAYGEQLRGSNVSVAK